MLELSSADHTSTAAAAPVIPPRPFNPPRPFPPMQGARKGGLPPRHGPAPAITKTAGEGQGKPRGTRKVDPSQTKHNRPPRGQTTTSRPRDQNLQAHGRSHDRSHGTKPPTNDRIAAAQTNKEAMSESNMSHSISPKRSHTTYGRQADISATVQASSGPHASEGVDARSLISQGKKPKKVVSFKHNKGDLVCCENILVY